MGDWEDDYNKWQRLDRIAREEIAVEERRKRVQVIILLILVIALAVIGVWLSITTSS